MAGKFVDLDDFGADAVRFAEDIHFLLAVEEFSAERIGGLEAGDENVVREVV